MNVEFQSLDPKLIILNFTVQGQVFSLPFAALDAYQSENTKRAIIRGVTVGGCGILMLVLAIINWKRKKTPMFYLNMATLTAAIIRNCIYLAYLLGPLAAPSFSFSGLISSSALANYHLTVASNAFQVVLILLVEMSMTYQIFVVFRAPKLRKLGWTLTTAAGMLGLALVALYINSAVNSSKIYSSLFNHESVSQAARQDWVGSLPNILFAASVNVLSVILLIKLGLAIRTRRFLGLKQFDGFHVLFIMSTQTMTVPSILVIVLYCFPDFQNSVLLSIAVMLVVLSLPLSSTWALAANNDPDINNTAFSFMKRMDSNASHGTSTTEERTLANVSILPEKWMPSGNNHLRSPDSFAELASASEYELVNNTTVLSPSALQDEDIFRNVHDGDFVAISTHNLK
ncbi:fungal pheromone mating factor STE2G-protein-coupled receptor [Suhomyces tanzawaensis NRRL Y-17324]|uniref:Fungal pheromone mating factor STE2G-protein-coupled receptor n=1 Tax=Suhomyces tanzawaensis NRRL Y-17324 TaxID=984487 RepID=A0A1E4SNX0_9ASCO|nr:fungal pheromone mating factor STE2G-protein-coupled receptor [Suhomyces tanzawaensis NRRL Y-17324]ODV81224.1 fungal pheromone mating factor STE2G-protein-coupled receptor [Suhomyces tanzawaensis NRRL Y-17324]